MRMPNVSCFASTHSSRCGRAGGFGFTFGSRSLAIGSSTTISCGRVQIVTSSPLARDTAIGTGGSCSTLLPGSFGSGTNGMTSFVVAPVSVAVVSLVGPAPASASGRMNPAFSSARAASLSPWTLKPSGSTVSPLPCATVTSRCAA
ncbi:hypothetical protein BE08_36990 [Sorangium cellulosum]|uniref:Uncharacterized protein n=1 Tax=Sorangium cellulosum TaxID=56 RepID=A0A150P8U8_SORCE|nr:hypothetical protein BE08_36990 [Sorangium cellulosum]